MKLRIVIPTNKHLHCMLTVIVTCGNVITLWITRHMSIIGNKSSFRHRNVAMTIYTHMTNLSITVTLVTAPQRPE